MNGLSSFNAFTQF